MNATPFSGANAAHGDSAEELSARFAQLVVQQTNMALMFLGKTAHPETGQTCKDLNAARLFIDQLEMLEIKTKGNLTRAEAGLLQQSLTALRLAFVEVVESPATDTQPTPSAPGPGPAAAEEESRKKFVKKY